MHSSVAFAHPLLYAFVRVPEVISRIIVATDVYNMHGVGSFRHRHTSAHKQRAAGAAVAHLRSCRAAKAAASLVSLAALDAPPLEYELASELSLTVGCSSF